MHRYSVSWAEKLELGFLPVPSGVIAASVSTLAAQARLPFVGSWKGKTRTLLHVRSRWTSQMCFWHHKFQMVSSYWLNWQMSMIVQGEYVCKTSLKQQKLKSWKRRHRSAWQSPLWSWYWGSRLLSYFKYVKGLMYQGLEINPIFNPLLLHFHIFIDVASMNIILYKSRVISRNIIKPVYFNHTLPFYWVVLLYLVKMHLYSKNRKQWRWAFQNIIYFSQSFTFHCL